MDYRNHIEAGSLLNTPPVFAVYVAMLTLRWIKKEGGLTEMEKRSKERANLFYNTIDYFLYLHQLLQKKTEA